MKKGWKMLKLIDLCDGKDMIVGGPFGSNLKVEDYIAHGIPILRLQNIGKGYFLDKDLKYISSEKAKELEYHSFRGGDIALAKLGVPIGKTCIIPNNYEFGIVVADVVRIRPDKKKVDYFFLKYFLNTDNSVSQLTGNISGATRPRVNIDDVRNILVPLPPLPEQQRIVSILDRCFTAIDKAKANAEQNLKNAKELFESYLQDVFEKKGEGWEEKRIDEICKLVNGRAYKKDELLTGGKYRVLRVGNFFTSDHWYYSDLELDEDKYCDKEDLLYAWSASFGPRIWKEEKVIYHYHIWKVIPDKNLVSRDFLFTLFEWDKEKIKAAQGTGTTMIHVSKGSMENRIVPVPPLIEQQTIIRQLDALRVETQKLESFYQQKIADLEELKKSILQKAFSGELSDTELYESKV